MAPIVVHAPLGTGGRPVTMLGQLLGVAHADADVLEFLRNANLPGVEELLDDPSWVTWRGGRAHRYAAA